MIHLYIVDDHPLMIEGIELLVTRHDGFQIVGFAKDYDQALEDLRALHDQIDIAILDISLQKKNKSGLDLQHWLKTHHPHIKVLILSMHNEPALVQSACLLADGYVLKNLGSEELVKAITSLDAGMAYYSPEITSLLARQASPINQDYTALTGREIGLLKWVGKGLSSEEIAQQLSIAKATVEAHKRNIKEKLGLKTSMEMMQYAIENGYTLLSDEGD